MTERTLGAKAGHLEMLKGGKKNKDGEVKKGGSKKFGWDKIDASDRKCKPNTICRKGSRRRDGVDRCGQHSPWPGPDSGCLLQCCVTWVKEVRGPLTKAYTVNGMRLLGIVLSILGWTSNVSLLWTVVIVSTAGSYFKQRYIRNAHCFVVLTELLLITSPGYLS